jgi:NAD(P)-dependent dehydrogenase (short-subunit alcohol dehydrogenase family)
MVGLKRKALIAAGVVAGGFLAARAILRQSRSFEWRGRTVIIAGASRGLGFVLARQLMELGADVTICARDGERLDAAAIKLRRHAAELDERTDRAPCGKLTTAACDIRDPRQAVQLAGAVLDRRGEIDVLINVAGIMSVGPFDAMTLDDFRAAMETNCWGHLNTIQAVLPAMRLRGWGRICNVASIGGKRAVPHMLPYDASKFALVGLSTGLRTELAKDGILVTTVCPGLMRTGSPRNADFKGRHREEYAWFSIGDGLPLVSMSAESAARKILAACRNGDAEAMIVGPGNFASLLSTLAPNVTAEILMLVDRLLPKMGGIGQESRRGYESKSEWSPSLITTLNERAAAANNEFAPEL